MDKPLSVLRADDDPDRLFEKKLVRNIVSGDSSAFSRLVFDYHPLAFSLAFKTLSDAQDAEEVVQDAFVKIFRAMPAFRGESSLKTWIMRIVLRLSLNRRRDRARTSWNRLGLHRSDAVDESPMLEPAVEQTPESVCISAENRRLVLTLVDQLPDGLREALILNSLEELSYEEIGRIMDIPVGTVGSRIHAARRKLVQKFHRHKLI